MKKYIAIMFSLFLLNGCGPSLKQTMATWEGNTMSDVIMSWGGPDRSSEIAGGKKVHTYDLRNGYGDIVCKASFIEDTNGIVVSYSARGWNCN